MGDAGDSDRSMIDQILAEEQELHLKAEPIYGRIRQTGHRPALVTLKLGSAEVTGTSFDVREWADALLMAVMASFWDAYLATWKPPGDPEKHPALHAAIKDSLLAHVQAMTPPGDEIDAIRGSFDIQSLLGPVPLVQITVSREVFVISAMKALQFAREMFAAAASAELTGGLYVACTQKLAAGKGMPEGTVQMLMALTMDSVRDVQEETRRFEEHAKTQRPEPERAPPGDL